MTKPPLCSALQGGMEPRDLRGFPENKAAAGSQHCLRRGGGLTLSSCSGQGEESGGSREFMFDLPGNSSSITTPALAGGEAKASLKGTAWLKRAAARDAELGAAHIRGLAFGERHSGVTAVTRGWGQSRSRLCAPLQPRRPAVPSWGQTHPHLSARCAHGELRRP